MHSDNRLFTVFPDRGEIPLSSGVKMVVKGDFGRGKILAMLKDVSETALEWR